MIRSRSLNVFIIAVLLLGVFFVGIFVSLRKDTETFAEEHVRKPPTIPIVPNVDERVFESLGLTEEMKQRVHNALVSEIIVSDPDDEDNSRQVMMYTDFLKGHTTAMHGIARDGSLNILLILNAGMEVETTSDNVIERVRQNMQKAVDHIFAKVFGFHGFPTAVEVKIFPTVAKSELVKITDNNTYDIVTFETEDDLKKLQVCDMSNNLSSCVMGNGMRAYHYILYYILYGEGENDYNSVFSLMLSRSTESDYIKAAMAMMGALPICNDIGPSSKCIFKDEENEVKETILQGIHHALLRQIWLYQKD